MKVTAERIPEARVVLEVEVDDERFQRSLDQAYRRLAPQARIPGFRRGKAPRSLVEQTLGRERLLQEAMDHLVPEAYDEAVRDQGLQPVASPELEILGFEPVRFKATVPVQPEVDLGDYQSIALRSEQPQVTDADVAAAVLELQRQHAVLEPVDRPVQYNDHLRADIRAEVDGRPVMRREEVELSLREGMTVAISGLTEQLLGLDKEAEHEIRIEVPEGDERTDLGGQMVTFLVTIHEIKQEILPEANDDLAAEVGGFGSFEALRKEIRADLQSHEGRRVENAHHQALLEALIERATIEFPPPLLDREVEHLLADMARDQGKDLAGYLAQIGQDPQVVRASIRPQARQRLLQALVLDRLAESEAITVSDADSEAEITRMAGDGPQSAEIRAVFESEDARLALRRGLLTSRAIERLAVIAAANAAGASTAPASVSTDPKNEEDAVSDAAPAGASPSAE